MGHQLVRPTVETAKGGTVGQCIAGRRTAGQVLVAGRACTKSCLD